MEEILKQDLELIDDIINFGNVTRAEILQIELVAKYRGEIEHIESDFDEGFIDINGNGHDRKPDYIRNLVTIRGKLQVLLAKIKDEKEKIKVKSSSKSIISNTTYNTNSNDNYKDTTLSNIKHVNKKRKIFISHSSLDKNLIDELATSLIVLGCDVFYSSNITTNKIKFGTESGGIYEKIKEEILNSDVVLFMVSNNFYNSIASIIEVGIAYTLGKDMIPVAFKSGNYKDDLKAVFNHTQLLACLDNEDDVMKLLEQVTKSSEVSKIYKFTKNIVSKNQQLNLCDGDCILSNELVLDIELKDIVSKFNKLSPFDYLFISYIYEERINEFCFCEDNTHWSREFTLWINKKKYSVVTEDIYSERFLRLLNRYNLLENHNDKAIIKQIGIEALEFIYNRDTDLIAKTIDENYILPF